MPGRKNARIVQTVMDINLQGVDSITEFFAQRFAPVKIVEDPPGRILGMQGRFGSLLGVDFSRTEFSGDFRIIPQLPQDVVFFCLPLKNTLTFRSGHESVSATPDMAVAIDMMTTPLLEIPDGYTHYALFLSRPLLVERLSVLLNHPVVNSLVFEAQIATRLLSVTALQSLLLFITSSSFSDELNKARLTAMRVHEMLIDFVLESWPNSYSKALNQPPPVVAPRHVKLAADFIRDNPQKTICGAELAMLTGTSLRSLQAGFRQFLGSSITAYQRQIRLERAREDIRREPGTPVQEIALRWGFTNTGRFTRYFREAYGISPARLARQ